LAERRTSAGCTKFARPKDGFLKPIETAGKEIAKGGHRIGVKHPSAAACVQIVSRAFF